MSEQLDPQLLHPVHEPVELASPPRDNADTTAYDELDLVRRPSSPEPAPKRRHWADCISSVALPVPQHLLDDIVPVACDWASAHGLMSALLPKT
jgi:hypothetical protein